MTDKLPSHWKPLVQLEPHQMFRRPEVTKETADHYGISIEEAGAMLDREAAKCMYFTNNLYQVEVSGVTVEDWFGQGQKKMLQLCVRRRDGGMIWDWRHLQQIKNELTGTDTEGVQLFPAESRKVDASNKWHIWVLADGTKFPFGWTHRDVQDQQYKGVPGLRQRPL
jgi:hypothetical protein